MRITSCDGSDARARRLMTLWTLIGYRGPLARKVTGLHDHEGNLTVRWSQKPSLRDMQTIDRLWDIAFDECDVFHYYRGREINAFSAVSGLFDSSPAFPVSAAAGK